MKARSLGLGALRKMKFNMKVRASVKSEVKVEGSGLCQNYSKKWEKSEK
jgi:hypothetical protein